jgi:hypothetical protein
MLPKQRSLFGMCGQTRLRQASPSLFRSDVRCRGHSSSLLGESSSGGLEHSLGTRMRIARLLGGKLAGRDPIRTAGTSKPCCDRIAVIGVVPENVLSMKAA